MNTRFNPAVSFGQQLPKKTAQPQKTQMQAQDDVLFSGASDTLKSKKGLAGKVAGGALAALALGVPFQWAFLQKTVDQNEFCIARNINDGVKPDSLEPGRHWKGAFMNKWTCFSSAPVRVTESVDALSIDNIPIQVNSSIAWNPDPNQGSRVLRPYGSGPSGDQDADVVAALAQIPDDENDAVYENALFSEHRSIVAEIAGLVPASQINKPAFYETVHDAILNGYVPRDIYNRFKDALVLQEGVEESEVTGVISSVRQPSLEERVAHRYTDYDADGNVVNDAPVIIISDADSRDNKILDPAYRQALIDLGSLPLQERAALEAINVREAEGQANLAEAEANNAVLLENTEEANARLILEAEAEAAATRETGSAENDVKAELAAILAANPELASVLTAEQLAELDGTLVLDGNSNVIIDGSGN